jgi:low temperature requirement protein LtrA
MRGAKQSLLRNRGHGHASVTNIELFFDLIFVFAVTQLSHSLLHDLSFLGAAHVLLLFLGVWWVWIYTSWVTNWLDPDRTPVRILLFVLMLAGLVLSISIPEAFEAKGLPFAIAFVGMQVGRSAFTLWAIGDASPSNTRNFQRITAWLVGSGVFWIAGGLLDGETRFALWIVALVIEYAGPSAGFWLPGLGRSTTEDWNVEGGHLAERCSQFVIIALGESVLVASATFAELTWAFVPVIAVITAFLQSIAMWWVYFDTGAERGSHKIAHSGDPGRLARLAYTYLHLAIVAGIIVTAAANELVLEHPVAMPDTVEALVIIGGPWLYLIGNMLFKRAIAGHFPLSHLIGFGLFVVLSFAASLLSQLWLAVGTTAILLFVAAWETVSLRRAKKESLAEFFAKSPLRGSGLEVSRLHDKTPK